MQYYCWTNIPDEGFKQGQYCPNTGDRFTTSRMITSPLLQSYVDRLTTLGTMEIIWAVISVLPYMFCGNVQADGNYNKNNAGQQVNMPVSERERTLLDTRTSAKEKKLGESAFQPLVAGMLPAFKKLLKSRKVRQALSALMKEERGSRKKPNLGESAKEKGFLGGIVSNIVQSALSNSQVQDFIVNVFKSMSTLEVTEGQEEEYSEVSKLWRDNLRQLVESDITGPLIRKVFWAVGDMLKMERTFATMCRWLDPLRGRPIFHISEDNKAQWSKFMTEEPDPLGFEVRFQVDPDGQHADLTCTYSGTIESRTCMKGGDYETGETNMCRAYDNEKVCEGPLKERIGRAKQYNPDFFGTDSTEGIWNFERNCAIQEKAILGLSQGESKTERARLMSYKNLNLEEAAATLHLPDSVSDCKGRQSFYNIDVQMVPNAGFTDNENTRCQQTLGYVDAISRGMAAIYFEIMSYLDVGILQNIEASKDYLGP
jgi:hypothetical protein